MKKIKQDFRLNPYYEKISNGYFIFGLLLFVLLLGYIEFRIGIFFLQNGAFDYYNQFFNADPLTFINSLQHRLSIIHPLLLGIYFLVIESIHYFWNVSANTRIVFASAIFGSYSVMQFGIFFWLVSKNKLHSFLMAIAFAFSFSTIIYSIVPDSFIVAQSSLGLMYIVFFLSYYKNRWPNAIRYIVIILVGVIVMGPTITNLLQFLITLIVFEYSVNKKISWKILSRIIIIAVVVIGITLTLYVLQVKAAPSLCSCSILDLELPSAIEEINKITRQTTAYLVTEQKHLPNQINSLFSTIKNMVFPALPIQNKNAHFQFSVASQGWGYIGNIIVTIFGLFTIYIGKNKKRNALWLSLLFGLVFNLIFHLFWGEGFFLYSQHFAFQFFALLGFTFIKYVNEHSQIAYSFLITIIALEIILSVRVIQYLVANI